MSWPRAKHSSPYREFDLLCARRPPLARAIYGKHMLLYLVISSPQMAKLDMILLVCIKELG